jgi:hypothetical protein
MLGGPVGTAAHLMVKTRRRRRLLVVGLLCALVISVSTVAVVIQQPIYIANVIVTRLFGASGPTGESIAAPDICVPPPSTANPMSLPPTYAPVTTSAAEPSPGESAPTDEQPPLEGVEMTTVPPAPPPAVLGTDGKPTEAAHRIMSEVPKGADMVVAEGYLLYRFAHPDGQFPRSWGEWVDTFYDTTSTMSSDASASDVVATMDPNADYRPYLLASAATTYKMVKEQRLSGDSKRVTALLSEIMHTCENEYRSDTGQGTRTSATPSPEPDQTTPQTTDGDQGVEIPQRPAA